MTISLTTMIELIFLDFDTFNIMTNAHPVLSQTLILIYLMLVIFHLICLDLLFYDEFYFCNFTSCLYESQKEVRDNSA
jgi:hypothetical protein